MVIFGERKRSSGGKILIIFYSSYYSEIAEVRDNNLYLRDWKVYIEADA